MTVMAYTGPLFRCTLLVLGATALAAAATRGPAEGEVQPCTPTATAHALGDDVWEGFAAPDLDAAGGFGGGYLRADGGASDGADAVAFGFLDVQPVSARQSRVTARVHAVRDNVDADVLSAFIDVVVDGAADDLRAVWRPADARSPGVDNPHPTWRAGDRGAAGVVVVVDAHAQTVVAYDDRAPATALWRSRFALPAPALACAPSLAASIVRISCRLEHGDDRLHFYGYVFDVATGAGHGGPILSAAVQRALAQPSGHRDSGSVVSVDGDHVHVEGHGVVVDVVRDDVTVRSSAGRELLRVCHTPTKRDVRFGADVIGPDLLLVWHDLRRPEAEFQKNLNSASQFAIYDLRQQQLVFAHGFQGVPGPAHDGAQARWAQRGP